MRVRMCAYVWVCVCTCAYKSSILSLVCSASKPEALQRVSERILNWIASACERSCLRLYFAALASTSSVSIAMVPTRHKTWLQRTINGTIRTISIAADRLPIVHRGRDRLHRAARSLQPRTLWPIRSRFFLSESFVTSRQSSTSNTSESLEIEQ